MYHIFIISSSVDGHLGSFQYLTLRNRAAMNMDVQASFRYMPKSGIADREVDLFQAP